MLVYKERGMLHNLISQDKIYTIIVVNTKLFDMFMKNKNLLLYICAI